MKNLPLDANLYMCEYVQRYLLPLSAAHDKSVSTFNNNRVLIQKFWGGVSSLLHLHIIHFVHSRILHFVTPQCDDFLEGHSLAMKLTITAFTTLR